MYLVITHLNPQTKPDDLAAQLYPLKRLDPRQFHADISTVSEHQATATVKLNKMSLIQAQTLAKAIYGSQLNGRRIYAYALLFFR